MDPAGITNLQNTCVQLAFMHLSAACIHWFGDKTRKHQHGNHCLAQLLYTKDHSYEFSVRILAWIEEHM